MKKNKLKVFTILLWLSFMVSTYLTFTFAFVSAYLDSSKSVLIHINNYGEAKIELFLLIIGLVLTIPAIFWINKWCTGLSKEDGTK